MRNTRSFIHWGGYVSPRGKDAASWEQSPPFSSSIKACVDYSDVFLTLFLYGLQRKSIAELVHRTGSLADIHLDFPAVDSLLRFPRKLFCHPGGIPAITGSRKSCSYSLMSSDSFHRLISPPDGGLSSAAEDS